MSESKRKRKPDAYQRPRMVRIAAPHCFGETVVPKALALVCATYPQLDLELVLNDRIADPGSEGVDISFRLGQVGEGAFIVRRLGQVGRVLVAAPGYVDQHGPISEPSDLAKHPFIRVRGMFGTDQLPLRRLASAVESAPIHTAVKTSHWRPMYEMIVAGAGIGVLEEPACVDARAAGRLVRLLPDFDAAAFRAESVDSNTTRGADAGTANRGAAAEVRAGTSPGSARGNPLPFRPMPGIGNKKVARFSKVAIFDR